MTIETTIKFKLSDIDRQAIISARKALDSLLYQNEIVCEAFKEAVGETPQTICEMLQNILDIEEF